MFNIYRRHPSFYIAIWEGSYGEVCLYESEWNAKINLSQTNTIMVEVSSVIPLFYRYRRVAKEMRGDKIIMRCTNTAGSP